MHRFLKTSLITLILLVVSVLAVFFFYPWQPHVESWLTEKLRAQSVPVTNLTLDSLNLTYAEFKNVTLALPEQLTIPTLRVEYTLQDKALDALDIRDINYTLNLTDATASDAPIMLPDVSFVRSLPIARIRVSDSTLHIRKGDMSATLPFTMVIDQQAETLVNIKGEQATIDSPTNDITLNNWHIFAHPEGDLWQIMVQSGAIDAALSPQSQHSDVSSGTLQLPDIANAEIMAISAPDIAVTYKQNGTTIHSQLSAMLSENGTYIALTGTNHTRITAPQGTINIPDWSARIIWPHQTLRVADVVLDDMTIDLPYQKGKRSNISSYPIPSLLHNLPLDTALSRGSHITIGLPDNNSITSAVTIQATLRTKPSITLEASNIVMSQGKKRYRADKLTTTLTASDNHWNVAGNVTSLRAPEQENNRLFPLSATFNGTVKPKTITMDVTASHTDFKAQSALSVSQGTAILTSPKVEIAGGNLSTDHITLGSNPIAANINFNNISLEELLKLTLKDSDSVKATGNVSGTIPVRYSNGALEIGEGALHSHEAGMVSIGEKHLGMLSSNNEQLQNVVKLLKHFEYKTLALNTTETDEKKLTIALALKGHNPDVYEGAEVHLNINLRGDVLQTVTSALGMMKSPQELLKGATHAPE